MVEIGLCCHVELYTSCQLQHAATDAAISVSIWPLQLVEPPVGEHEGGGDSWHSMKGGGVQAPARLGESDGELRQ